MTRDEFLELKPSELVRAALEDLVKCEADPYYVIDMGEWHTAIAHEYDSTCEVCFAGAVMAQTLEVPHYVCSTPHSLTDEVRDRLYMLDDFQDGSIVLGLSRIGIKDTTYGEWYDFYIMPYVDDPEMFHRDMECLASELEAQGY